MPFGSPLSSLRLSAANNSPGISTPPPSPPLAKNERYATFFPGQFRISTGRLGKFPGHSYRHHAHPHPLFPPIICSTWRGGRILSAGPLYSWRASDAVFGACLRMACTCLSQQHTGLWDVFLEAYQVLFSAGASVCLIQAPNPGKSGPNMPSKSFHYLPEKLQTLFLVFSCFFIKWATEFYSDPNDKLVELNAGHTQELMQSWEGNLAPPHCLHPDLNPFSWKLCDAVEKHKPDRLQDVCLFH